MTAQHTPGEWSVCEDGVSVYQSELDTLISTVAGEPALWGIDDDTMRANARLIAAAPDLLAAATAHLYFMLTSPLAPGGMEAYRITENLRAAIARATGQTP